VFERGNFLEELRLRFKTLVTHKSQNCLKLPMNLPRLSVYSPSRPNGANSPDATNDGKLSRPSITVP
jgi:hypothetical protein